jgi:RNA recognition motif-containing protein
MFHQRSLCISNLPHSASEPDIFHYFGAYGALSSASIVWDCSLEEKDNAGARPRIALVVMETAASAAAAIAAPPTIHGRLLQVEYTVSEDVESNLESSTGQDDAVDNCGTICGGSSDESSAFPAPPITLHSLADAHALATSVKNLIVVGHEPVWQSASDATSILPLLHMLRRPDDAAARLVHLGEVDPSCLMEVPTALAPNADTTTMEHVWTSHRPLQWFNPHALKSTLQLVGVKPTRAEAAVAWIFAGAF